MGAMEFRVLGPLEVIGPRGPIEIGSGRQRAILALLVLHVGETLSTDRLIEQVWGEDPPPSAHHTLGVHMSGLRRAIGAAWIQTQPHGYRLRADGSDVDLGRFEVYVAEASRAFAAGDPQAASAGFGAALALWRGPALGDLAAGNAQRAERARLDELRAFALERRIDADLACGRHLELVPELRRLIGEMPLREAFHARLMVALYRSGRQADALDVYRRARAVLDGELGVEPGEELEALQRDVLAHDPSLRFVAVSGAVPRTARQAEVGAASDAQPELIRGAAAAQSLDSQASDRPAGHVTQAGRVGRQKRETRRTVTTVIADLAISTLGGESLDPESARHPLDRCYAEMAAVLERHGGTVEQTIGDAVMAVFGVPLVHEDDALRAVRGSAEMRSALGVLNEGLLRDLGVRIEMRMGLNTGEVVHRETTGSTRRVTGDAVNIAARLEEVAAPGEIILGDQTYQLVRDAVEVGPAESIALRGQVQPVVAYRLKRVTGPIGHRPRFDAEMVGRERELDALQQAFERAVAGRSCQLFTILGSAGIGKSRLVTEFLGVVRDRARVLRGRCLPYGEGITYWPVAEIVRQVAAIQDDDSAEMVRRRIDAFVAGLPEAAAFARGLEAVIGLEVPAAQEELFWAFRRLLLHLADERPLVVVVEDIHWAEPTLLDLVESVAGLARAAPLLIVCPARPEILDDRPTWGGGNVNATTILLEPLAEGSALRLIDSLVPPGALRATVRARIADAAEGNPLYVEEFVAKLIDEGALATDVEGRNVAPDLDSIAVSPTIQALLSARLDQLPLEERVVAERASVVGRAFDLTSVIALSRGDDVADVPRRLSSLVRKELIRPERSERSGRETFRFRHQLIRDAAYQRLPKSERAELHEVFANWLDLASGDRRSEVDEMVGYHLEQAFRYRLELAPVDERGREIARRAAQQLIVAGHRALARSDVAATVNLLGRAATLLEPSDPARLAILPDLGRALASNGRLDEATACFAEALKGTEAAGDERAFAHARILQYLSGRVAPGVSIAELRRVADSCIAVFERHGDDRGLAFAWQLHAGASNTEGRLADYEASLARALEHARRAGDRFDETLTAYDLGIVLTVGPTPVPEAIRRCQEIVDHAPDDRAIEMAMSHPLAHLRAHLGEFEPARQLAARCREIAAQNGQETTAAFMTEVAWDVESLAGDHEAARRVVSEGRDWFAARGEPHPLLEAFLARSQAALGLDVAVDRLAIAAAGQSGWARAVIYAAMARAEVNTGNLAEAERHARSAVDILVTTEVVTWHAEARVVLGDVLRVAGRREEADRAFREALDLYRQKGSIVGERNAAARLAGKAAGLPIEPAGR